MILVFQPGTRTNACRDPKHYVHESYALPTELIGRLDCGWPVHAPYIWQVPAKCSWTLPVGYRRVTRTLHGTLEKIRTLTDVRKTLKDRYISVKNALRTLKNVGNALDRRTMDVTKALSKRYPSARHALDTRPWWANVRLASRERPDFRVSFR